MQTASRRLKATVAITLIFVSACASTPPPRKVTASERIEFDRAIGSELAHQFDPKLKLVKDAAIQEYLLNVAQGVASKNPELSAPAMRVFLVQDSTQKYRSYGLPGGRLYFSVGILKSLQFESEAAAMAALEFGHLYKEHVLEYLRKNASGISAVMPLKTSQALEDIEFFGADGMFSFTAKQDDEAVENAVSLLYDAGYDPRGLVALLQKFRENPAHSPWDPEETNHLIDQARRAIALLTPLRNPIVQTDSFEQIRTRFLKL